ncbi:MAG: phosphate transport system regulatory protein PhoU [Alphaproteobacteria bacterium]|nr:phosphate transport system regulatory protein PhoU [Alphaproteobacteria bacterium]
MNDEHIVSSFDRDLAELNQMVARLGGLAEQQFAAAIDALENRNASSIETIVSNDAELDQLEKDLNDRAIEVIATRGPMATDLRRILSAVKIAAVLERVGDYAKNIAKRSLVIISDETNRSDTISVGRIADIVQGMLREALDAYATANADLAMEVWERDQEVDELYTSLHGDLLGVIAKGAEEASVSSHFLFIAKNIERIGDHTTAVAEQVYFQVHGEMPSEERPKANAISEASDIED